MTVPVCEWWYPYRYRLQGAGWVAVASRQRPPLATPQQTCHCQEVQVGRPLSHFLVPPSCPLGQPPLPAPQHPHGPPCVLPLVVDLSASLKAMVPRGGGHRSAAAASPGAPSPGRTHAPVPWCPCEQRRPEQEVGSREGPSSARDLPDRNSVSCGCHKTSLRVLWK